MLGKGETALWVNQAQLAKMIHVSPSTVGRAIRDLIELGYLTPKEERHEERYRVYERKVDVSLDGGHPGTCSRDPSLDAGGALDSGNKPRNDHKEDHKTDYNGKCEIPRELIEQINLVKQKPLSPCERTRHIAHVVMQFLPYNVTEGDERFRFFVPPAMVPFGTFTPESENIDDLKYQFQQIMKEEKDGFALEGARIAGRIDILERKRDGIPHQVGKGNQY